MSRKASTYTRNRSSHSHESVYPGFMGFFLPHVSESYLRGKKNVGLYQLVFPVYALGISLSCAGMELALSRCVAREAAAGRIQKARELLKTSLIFTFSFPV